LKEARKEAAMSDTHLYLSLIPEALVASMLTPEEFGRYLAVGTRKRLRGEVMFFSLKPEFRNDFFDWSAAERHCVPHADGSPKHTVYLGVYRVLEHVPLSALLDLYLVTRDGRVLTLGQAIGPADFTDKHYLYDEICPLHPVIVSSLNPVEFCKFITDPKTPIHVPRICFVQLDADAFIRASKADPESHPLNYLPDRVRECCDALDKTEKRTKTVDRAHQLTCGWRNVKNGYFVGDQEGLIHYPLPSENELDRDYHDWWRSATM
jgi:hypothetical protein